MSATHSVRWLLWLFLDLNCCEEDHLKTSFITPWGCFAYRVMPFGLTNAPATFQRFVTSAICHVCVFPIPWEVYLGVCFCIYSSCVLHLAKVEEGLARLQSLGGQLNVDKCHIAESKVTILGHVVSKGGIEANPQKIQSLVSPPSPTTTKQLVSFIQKVRYLSRFIDLISQLILPLQQLTNQSTFSWDEVSKQRFREVKQVLSSLPTIAPPNWEEIFYVNPSVGDDTLGSLLM